MNRTAFGYAFGVVLLVFGLVLVGHTAEITYQLDIVQEVVTKDVLVRTAENVIVLMDASKSMAFDNPKYKKQKYLRKIIGIKIDDINFDYDKFELKPKENEELNQVGQFLQANPNNFVAVQGFCDNRGSADYNMKLSRDRAEAVTDFLVKNFKLDSDLVVTMWYGDMNPIADNGTADGRAKNRRVEITIMDLRYLSR